MSARTPEFVPAMLREYGQIVRTSMADYLPDGAPARHFYDLVADYPHRGGKMMRPSICVATALAFGGDIAQASRAAAAVELLHNALLVHDDIEDESLERRGRPTLHELHGIPLAVNAGDGLLMFGLKPLADCGRVLGPRLAQRLFEETLLTARETAEGQALELGWRRDNRLDLDEADYMLMVLKKTCWLGTIFPMRLGALIGSGDAIDLEAFIRFGFFLGAAFQIQDDLLNFIADRRYGKEYAGDIWEGKRTPMLIRLLGVAGRRERARIAQILALPRQRRSAAQIAWIRSQMDHHGCIAYARNLAHGLAGAAMHEFSRAYAGARPGRDSEFIRGLVTWVFERTTLD